MEKIELKLVIDGKEASQTLNITNQELQNIAAKGKNTSQTFQNITAELKNFSIANEESIAKMTQFLAAQNVTEDEIREIINALKNQSSQLNINSTEWGENQARLQIAAQAYQNLINQNLNKMQPATKGTTAGISQMTNAIGALGWTLGDANMFLVNFRAGMMSVANNIPMIIQGFLQAKAAAEAAGASIKTALVASLAGPGGLMLAINGVMFLLQILPGLFDNTTESVEKQKEQIDKLKESYKQLTREQIQNQLAQIEPELAKLEKELAEKRFSAESKQRQQVAAGSVATGVTVTPTVIKDVDLIGEDSYKKLTDYRLQVKMLKEAYTDLGDVENIQNRITQNKKKLEDLNQFNFSKLVPNAKTIEEARATLLNWIKSDEESLSKLTRLHEEKTTNLIKTQDEYNKALEELRIYRLNDVEKELYQLDKWYEEKKKILKGNNEALLELDRIYLEKKAAIMDTTQFWELPKPQEPQLEEIDVIGEFGDKNQYKRKNALEEVDIWEQAELEKVKNYANAEEMMTAIHEAAENKRKEITEATYQASMERLSTFFGGLSVLFGKNTAAYKVFSTIQIIIDSIQATMAAYKSTSEIPIVGPVLAPIAAASAAAFGAVQIARINSVQVPAYEKGGVIVGEKGMEIIAPAKDYAEGQALIALATAEAVLKGIGDIGSNSGNLEQKFDQFFSRLDNWNRELTFIQKGSDLVSVVEREQSFRSRMVQ